jgi:hypothetical protein
VLGPILRAACERSGGGCPPRAGPGSRPPAR